MVVRPIKVRLSHLHRAEITGVLDVRPNYLVLRVGTRKGINMEVAFKAASDLNYQMLRLAGPILGRALPGSMQLSPTYSRAVISMVSGFMV